MQEIVIRFKTDSTYSPSEIKDLNDGLKEMLLEIDDAIDAGSVIVTSGEGKIDAERVARSWLAENEFFDNVKIVMEIEEENFS